MCSWTPSGHFLLGSDVGHASRPEVIGNWTKVEAMWIKGGGQTEDVLGAELPTWKVRHGEGHLEE